MLFKATSIIVVCIGTFMPITATAAGIEKVCTGLLTDMRTIGVQLGNCDRNSISENQFKRVTDICGSPGGVDKTSPECRIRAIVLPHKPNKYGTGFVDVVQKVLQVSKGTGK
jgi:hypothetical protein